MKAYLAEIDGQREFYSRIGINPDLSHNTDGVDRGNLYENKLNIDNINKVLFQAIKYASRIRIRGEKLPANIILNDLNREIVYIFQSADLLADIEKVYFGAASKGNDEFTTTAKHTEIDYSQSSGLMQLLQYVNSDNFVKYHIDKFNIIGLVVIPNTDALAYDIIPAEHNEQGIANDYIREKVNDENCVVILMENPPYSESGSGGVQNTGKKENAWKQSFVIEKMREEYKGVVLNDLSNLFIWSGFKYYLKKPCDSYILYSPTKYWRNQNLVNKQFRGGFFCNRKEFHAKQVSAIGCIWWGNLEDTQTKELVLAPYDVEFDKVVRANDDIIIKKAYHNLSEAYDMRCFEEDVYNGIISELDGKEFKNDGRQITITKPLYNKNIIGYMDVHSFSIDRKLVHLTRVANYQGHGFYLRSDNYLEKLPLFVAATFPYDKWYKTDVYSKSYDGQGAFVTDKDFLKRCLIYTALTPKNKCQSLIGSDKRFYKNELCFDKEDTLAYNSLKDFINNGYELSEAEENLLKYWNDVVFEIKRTEEYKKVIKQYPDFRFGLWQIMEDINIKIDSGRKNRKGEPVLVYKYANLNTAIKTLDTTIKMYYETYIVPLLFKYELIK